MYFRKDKEKMSGGVYFKSVAFAPLSLLLEIVLCKTSIKLVSQWIIYPLK